MSLLTSFCRRVGGIAYTPMNGIKQCAYYGLLKGGSVTSSSSPGSFLVSRCMSSLQSMIKKGPTEKQRKPGSPMLDGAPQKRGVVLKVIIKKPKKPNSANRKCVRVRLTNGKEAYAYVPGEGHNLQEHSIVLVEGARCRDLPAVKLQCVRGKYDLAHVKKDK